MGTQVIRSGSDRALNIIQDAPVGKIETRYVDKGTYQVIYLSSQTGCNHGCRFCHLTTSGQTDYENVSPKEFYNQTYAGLNQTRPGDTLHFDYMARGEPLANPWVDSTTLQCLTNMAQMRGFKKIRHLISTIMPREFVQNHELIDRFPIYAPDIYYSFYTTSEDKRKRWMPNAAPYQAALDCLKRWQDFTHKIPKVHFAIIPGLNDDCWEIAQICDAIRMTELRVNFNLIEYNHHEAGGPIPKIGLADARQVIHAHMPSAKVNLIPRIAPDAYVSCGMFVGGTEE